MNANDKGQEVPVDTIAKAELKKLQLEIQEIKGKNHWADRTARYIPLMSVMITVAGLCFGIYQFGEQQDNNREASKKQVVREIKERKEAQENRAMEQVREQQLRERELFKPLWDQQIELYFEASSIVATIATTESTTVKAAAVEKFWQLYQGPLVIVESTGISGAMVTFGKCLNDEEQCSKKELEKRSRALATQVQESLSKSWSQGLGGFSDGKYKYH